MIIPWATNARLAAQAAAFFALGLLAAACSDETQPNQGAGTRSTGPGDWTAGDYPADLTGPSYLEIADLPNQGGAVRQYKVHVPPSYSPDKPTPVVFCFHGLGQNAVLFCVNGAGMVEKSDQEGFILVMPNGHQNSWNAGTCCGGAASTGIDDVGFVRAVFAEISEHLNIDLGRVYATGLSNGGYMSYRLACEASDLFVAVAPARAPSAWPTSAEAPRRPATLRPASPRSRSRCCTSTARPTFSFPTPSTRRRSNA